MEREFKFSAGDVVRVVSHIAINPSDIAYEMFGRELSVDYCFFDGDKNVYVLPIDDGVHGCLFEDDLELVCRRSESKGLTISKEDGESVAIKDGARESYILGYVYRINDSRLVAAVSVEDAIRVFLGDSPYTEIEKIERLDSCCALIQKF